MTGVQGDVLEIRTADNVGIGYEVAGLGTRLLAFLVDLLVVSLILFIVQLFVVALLPGDELAAALIAGGVSFFVFAGYFIVAETASGGRTPGKRALSVRVVRVDGGAPGLQEALVRGLVRIFDLPLGIFPMFATAQSRRFGDLAAGTVVVRERRALAMAPPAAPILLRTPDAGPAIDGIANLGPREAAVLRTFLSRPGIAPELRARLAAQMAARLLDRMNLPPGAPERQWPPELLLERLYLQLAASPQRP